MRPPDIIARNSGWEGGILCVLRELATGWDEPVEIRNSKSESLAATRRGASERFEKPANVQMTIELMPWQREGWEQHTRLLLDSYRRWLGRELLEPRGTPADDARALFEAPFVVVSHGTEADPIFNYGNRTALDLWQMDLPTFLGTPSRQTVEPSLRDERERLLQRTVRDGFADNYSGIRISATGRRFRINQAIIWNLIDKTGTYAGQAATFSAWEWVQ